MYAFNPLDKTKKSEYLPRLFDILYSNMNQIAPSDASYSEECTEFLLEVSSALDKAPRQIVLCYFNDELAGFLMYYTRNDMIMIEELQITKKHQRTRLLYNLCKYMMGILPPNIEFIESFAHKSNSISLSLQQKLGMEIIEEVNTSLLHLRGNATAFKTKIK